MRVVFGVTGGNCLYLSDAIGRSGMRYVAMHGEREAGYAAIGYAKQRNGLGTVLVTTGCGSTNVLTPVLSAWQDSVPLVVLAGQVPNAIRKGLGRQQGTQGANLAPIVSSIVKGFTEWEVINPGRSLMGLALEHRRGPVWISVPLDVSCASLGPE